MKSRRTKQQILAEIRLLKTNKDNYIETVIRADPYSLVADRMLEKIPHSVIFEGKTYKEVREYCKNPTMTYFYNSRMEPIKAFGEDTQELQAFYETLSELFPGAVNVMEALNDRWDTTALFHTWSTPDGHVAHVKVMEHIDGHLDNEGLDLPYRFEKNQPSLRGTSLSPNFIHSLDGFLIRHVADNLGQTFSHIHDEYQSHPNHMGRVRELFIDGVEVIANAKLLETFCEQDFGIDTKDFIKGLKTSSYAIC